MKSLLALFMTVALFACTNGQNSENKQLVDVKEFSELLKTDEKIQLVDVRTPEEYSAGFIKGAINIDYRGANFQKESLKLDKSQPVLVYCRSGGRSAGAAEYLLSQGFKVIELDGGIMNWQAEGQSIVTKD